MKYLIRHSGRIINVDPVGLWAFHHTGTTVERWQIKKLTPSEYEYGDRIPLLGPMEASWASAGMHTFSALKLDDGWVVVVDGWWNDFTHTTFHYLEGGSGSCQNKSSCQE